MTEPITPSSSGTPAAIPSQKEHTSSKELSSRIATLEELYRVLSQRVDNIGDYLFEISPSKKGAKII